MPLLPLRLARLRQLGHVGQIRHRRFSLLLIILDDRRLPGLTLHPRDWFGSSLGLLALLVAEDGVVVAGDG